MPEFNRRFIEQTAERFRKLAPDSKPLWGRMSSPQMLAHLAQLVKYSIGKEPETPNEGGWFGHYVAAPLILNGVIKIPKNSKAPRLYERQAPHGDVPMLTGELTEFLTRLEDASFNPPAHPYFGRLDAHQWAKLHVIHIDHHATQFGV